MSDNDCPFCNILNGDAPGTIVAKDEQNQFALIQSIHPIGTVHWLAVPCEHISSTEVLEQADPDRFLDLVSFAIEQAKNQRNEHPELMLGYTIKFHFGSYETVPHAKLHILSVE